MTSNASGVHTKIGNANPWTEYVKYLPAKFFLPTFWNGSEQDLLKGTSLEIALASKLQSLDREFTHLRDATQPLECCRYWWDPDIGNLDFEDWKLIDAMYRSRAMDLPDTGLALVPCMDMANHASGDGCCALYETDESCNATLTLLPNQNIKKDDEITISYGDEKGACEMLFSYGFIPEGMENAQSIFLDLDIPDDDPLKFAKKSAFDVAPGFRVYMYQGTTTWLGPFVWLQCINEEDGLQFRVVQTNEGEKELTVSWKGEVIRGILALEDCIKNDRSFTLFQLRAITVLQQRIQDQLSKLHTSNQKFEKSVKDSSGPGLRVVEYASRLRDLENKLLYRASQDFDAMVSLPAILWECYTKRHTQQQVHLYNTDAVQEFLDPEQFAEAQVVRVRYGYDDDDETDPNNIGGHGERSSSHIEEQDDSSNVQNHDDGDSNHQRHETEAHGEITEDDFT